ncbi:DUF3612 domain-containing protein [Pseudohongiella sp. SYSU M77423]|uniref:DUF3612 domain-containing protein n=1 Tax=Pseudohongiella sp. SYSU M77423 TaxID=3042312 RepID=UPI0024806E60|nr:DUF3612 domain-containing protein [Pseudohongiella sp. SYSU M77423]MDH7943862.1 DUF3612 domain-containing protein [Pseudohongiella sp. SYSU M77423]MEC8858516.1 DUF3612 domain-containing protein [Pseudomonadota bacterium]
MVTGQTLTRRSHFLGTKIRNLRKRNRLTMEDLSARCVKLDPELAPSVSYLSMIERGKRVPARDTLAVIAAVFQKDPQWFMDDAEAEQEIRPDKSGRGGIAGIALEPGFLFSQEILQIAIPEMLAQTGTSGRQLAHLLIRAHQEHHRNHFPDIERAAEEVGGKQLPIHVDDMLSIIRKTGVKIKWFSRTPKEVKDEAGVKSLGTVRSFFDPPGTLYLNETLKKQAGRLKYDLALHIGHFTLHNKDGLKSVLLAGRSQSNNSSGRQTGSDLDAQDILNAWRDFECSFFAGALLCPKVPFRQLLDRNSYEVGVHKQLDVSPSVVMRRMTAVSPYPHWHYFDAYAPGTLKAVYRGNGIPLPWGNMRQVEDPCQHWSVFRMLADSQRGASAQISVLDTRDGPRIYCCESVPDRDMADNPHVLCAGIDLNPALDAAGSPAREIAQQLKDACAQGGGDSAVPDYVRRAILSAGRILNIAWVERGLANPARLICSRGSMCPRIPSCYPAAESADTMTVMERMQQEIREET